MKRIVILAAGCLLLAACFKSERLLLDLEAAVHPMPEGEWTASDTNEDMFTLTKKGDHYLRVEGDSRYDVVVTPLAGRADTFIAAESAENCTGHDASPECNWEYAIVIVGKDETWKQFAPNCKEPWEGMDKDVGVREDDGETCWFDDAAGLQHALAVAAERGSSNEQLIHRPVELPSEGEEAGSE
jgi:hypothetical protein